MTDYYLYIGMVSNRTNLFCLIKMVESLLAGTNKKTVDQFVQNVEVRLLTKKSEHIISV